MDFKIELLINIKTCTIIYSIKYSNKHTYNHPHANVKVDHSGGKYAGEKASADEKCPRYRGNSVPQLGTGH